MVRNRKLAVLATCGILVIVFLAVARESAAIPAFARKYATSCATCHESYPRLNAVGEAFRLNGFKFADDELYIKEEPVEMGDDAYKRIWPNAIWPSDIPGTAPLAFTLTSDASADIGGTRQARTEFTFPRQAKLLGAGALGDSASAFAEIVFSRQSAGQGHGHGGGGEEGTETDIEGWLQFEDLFGIENAVNIRVGTVGMQEMGLFTARDHNRFSVNPYLYSTWMMPTPDEHELAEHLAEDHDDGEGEDDHGEAEEIAFQGNTFMIHAQPGIEVNGFGQRWRYAVGVVNGNFNGISDNNSEKDLYAQLAFKLGGLGFDGSGMGTDGKLETSSESWRDDSVTLSLFGYYGASPIELGMDTDTDRFWRCGPGVLCRWQDLQFGAGYIFGENESPYGALSGRSVDSQSWFIEGNYFALPWLVPFARYEELDIDIPSVEALDETVADADRARTILGAKMLLRANVSLTLEGRFYSKNDLGKETNDSDQLIASLSVAF